MEAERVKQPHAPAQRSHSFKEEGFDLLAVLLVKLGCANLHLINRRMCRHSSVLIDELNSSFEQISIHRYDADVIGDLASLDELGSSAAMMGGMQQIPNLHKDSFSY
jgi:hypothetical protein